MPQPPNFLILLTDQQRFDTIAAAGFHHMRTPNMDRLVREGCLFTNAYSPNPICVPARHCLLTGLPPRHHGFYDNSGQFIQDDGIATLPQILAENQYFTAAVGKMHFRPTRNHNGYLEMHLMEEGQRYRADDAYATYLAEQGFGDLRALHGVRPLIYHEPQRALMPPEHHGEAWLARRAIEVLQKKAERPFFMTCGFIKPHPPWNIPAGWENHYDGVELPEPIPGPRPPPYFTAESPWFGDHDSKEARRAIRAAYYTSISFVDQQIGLLLDYLEQQRLLDNTFIIFTSDHGEMLQDHGMYQKAVPFESAAHIPFVVRAPNFFQHGSTDDRFVDLMDILPTVLDAANLDYYQKPGRRAYRLPGDSIMRQESDRRDRTHQFAGFGRRETRWGFMRDHRYKYVYHYNGGIEYLFDLQSDPRELHNLADSPDRPQEVYQRLRRKFIEHEQTWGPEESLQDGDLAVWPCPPPDSARGLGKYPNFANHQPPRVGREAPEREGELLVNDIQAATNNAGPEYFQALAPEPFWLEQWQQLFIRDGGTPEQCRRITGL
ncbi:MAG: sulfatase [Kiritimatiellia bacterium]